jgi:hypothetical protein
MQKLKQISLSQHLVVSILKMQEEPHVNTFCTTYHLCPFLHRCVPVVVAETNK